MVELLSKSVQELAITGEEPPENYIYKDGDEDGVIDTSIPLVDVPIVDFSRLSTSSPDREEELGRLRSALDHWGCFQAINHGMSISFLDAVRGITKQFFKLPMEEKRKYSREVDDIEGYGNDMVLSADQTLDWSDRLYLMVHPQDARKLRYWPQSPRNFREILQEFTKSIYEINEKLLKDMAVSLNLEENCFLNQYGEGATMSARFNYYPQCRRPDRVLGVKPHADGSAITYLLQDKQVIGLQVLKDDQWVRVPTIPHALLINAGDQLEIMSNGIFKSPMHRVGTNSEMERISVAVFCLPERDKEIEPVDGLVDEKRPRLYKKIKNFVDYYFQNYQKGKRAIDLVKI